jgi:magnesium-transporting ATPase (P-type)
MHSILLFSSVLQQTYVRLLFSFLTFLVLACATLFDQLFLLPPLQSFLLSFFVHQICVYLFAVSNSLPSDSLQTKSYPNRGALGRKVGTWARDQISTNLKLSLYRWIRAVSLCQLHKVVSSCHFDCLSLQLSRLLVSLS